MQVAHPNILAAIVMALIYMGLAKVWYSKSLFGKMWADNLDSGSQKAIDDYMKADTKQEPMKPQSWNETQQSFEAGTKTAQQEYREQAMVEFYNDLARERHEAYEEAKKQEEEQQKKMNDMSMERLFAMLAQMSGRSRFEKLMEILAENRRKEREADEKDKKELQEFIQIIQEEIKKEELSRQNIRELNKNKDISLEEENA